MNEISNIQVNLLTGNRNRCISMYGVIACFVCCDWSRICFEYTICSLVTISCATSNCSIIIIIVVGDVGGVVANIETVFDSSITSNA